MSTTASYEFTYLDLVTVSYHRAYSIELSGEETTHEEFESHFDREFTTTAGVTTGQQAWGTEGSGHSQIDASGSWLDGDDWVGYEGHIDDSFDEHTLDDYEFISDWTQAPGDDPEGSSLNTATGTIEASWSIVYHETTTLYGPFGWEDIDGFTDPYSSYGAKTQPRFCAAVYG